MSTNVFFGAENMTLLLAEQLKKKYQVFYASPSGEINYYLSKKRISHIEISKISVVEILRLNQCYGPVLFHAVDFRASTYCALAGVPFVAHLHNNPPWLKKICANSLAMLFFALKAKRVICVSESVVNEFIFFNLIQKKVVVLENVLDEQKIIKEAGEIPAKRKYDIGFVGRLTEQKDPVRLIELIYKVACTRKVNAMIIGEGEMKERVEKEIEIRGLQDRIVMLGFQRNPYQYIKSMKLLLMPSRWEGFGLTAVEAMLLGCPVLGTNVGGLEKVIGKESKDICISDNDFIYRINELLSDYGQWKKESEKVRIRGKQFCNLNKYVKEIESIYKRSFL